MDKDTTPIRRSWPFGRLARMTDSSCLLEAIWNPRGPILPHVGWVGSRRS